MKYDSKIVYLFEANGASEKVCKDADKKLKEMRCLFGADIADSYEDALFLGTFKEKNNP